jgi:hypothetical protein
MQIVGDTPQKSKRFAARRDSRIASPMRINFTAVTVYLYQGFLNNSSRQLRSSSFYDRTAHFEIIFFKIWKKTGS